MTKKVELSRQQKVENFIYTLSNLSCMLGAIVWYVGLVWHTRKKHDRYAGTPFTIQLFGIAPMEGADALNMYSMRYAVLGQQWVIVDNQVGKKLLLWVSQAAFDYADNILFQYRGCSYQVLSQEGSKRGQGLRRPYTQRQARPASRAVARPTTGKRYR